MYYWGEFLQQLAMDKNFILLLRSCLRCRKQVGNTFIEVKTCTSDAEPGVVEETIPTKEQPGNENDLEPSTTVACKMETTKTQLSSPDQGFVNVLDSPYQPKIFKDLWE